MRVRLIAGRLGCGGGPFVLFPPHGHGKPLVLEKAEGDQSHEPMPVQTPPGAALEVVKPEFLFQLLVCLLAHPAHLDDGRQPPQARVGRQIGKIVLALARCVPLAH